ncbi:hypothetical protein C6N75_28825, partial [Streptomyces solincola]
PRPSRHDLPEDGTKTLPTTRGLTIGRTAGGHQGASRPARPGPPRVLPRRRYDPDRGPRRRTRRTATADHGGATGRPATLRAAFADRLGETVTRSVRRAPDVR